MAAAIELRSDFDGDGLRRIAWASRDGRQVRRLMSLAALYDGETRSEAARIGGVGLQIVREPAVRFNACGPDGLVDGKAPGAQPQLSAEQRRMRSSVVLEPRKNGGVRSPDPVSQGAPITSFFAWKLSYQRATIRAEFRKAGCFVTFLTRSLLAT